MKKVYVVKYCATGEYYAPLYGAFTNEILFANEFSTTEEAEEFISTQSGWHQIETVYISQI